MQPMWADDYKSWMTGKIASQNDLITSLASRYSTSIPTDYVTFVNIGGKYNPYDIAAFRTFMLNFDRVYNIPALTFPTPSIWPTTSPLLIYKRDAACTPTSTKVPSITPAPVVTPASPIAPPTSVPAVATPSGPPLIVKAWINPNASFTKCPAIRASTSSAAAAAYAATQTTPLPHPPPSSSPSVFWKSECLYDPGENCVPITHPLSNSGTITLAPEPSALLPGVILPAQCLDNGSNCDPNGIFITAQGAGAAATGVVEMIPEPMPAGADGIAGNVD